MSKHSVEDSNESGNSTIESNIQSRVTGRSVVLGGLSATVASSFLGSLELTGGCSNNDNTASVLNALGDPIAPDLSDYSNDGSEDGRWDRRAGDHHDAMAYCPLPKGSTSSERGLLAINNCGNGVTPWGSCLTGEENFFAYFTVNDPASDTDELARYGIASGARLFNYKDWDKDENAEGLQLRFNISRLGASARNEYIYKYLSAAMWDPADAAGGLDAGDKYLHHGMLYAAKFNDDGSGGGLPMTTNNPNLGAMSAAEIAVFTRIAADRAGDTKKRIARSGTASTRAITAPTVIRRKRREISMGISALHDDNDFFIARWLLVRQARNPAGVNR